MIDIYEYRDYGNVSYRDKDSYLELNTVFNKYYLLNFRYNLRNILNSSFNNFTYGIAFSGDSREYPKMSSGIWGILRNCLELCKVKIGEDTFFLGKGVILDKDLNPLLCLTINQIISDAYMITRYKSKYLTLFIASEFIINYPAFYNATFKNYIIDFIQEDVNANIVKGSYISDLVFNTGTEIQISNIDQLESESKLIKNCLFLNPSTLEDYTSIIQGTVEVLEFIDDSFEVELIDDEIPF